MGKHCYTKDWDCEEMRKLTKVVLDAKKRSMDSYTFMDLVYNSDVDWGKLRLNVYGDAGGGTFR